MYPTRPPEAALLFGPHMYPTGDRDPRPEDEEDDELLPEPTDFGRPPGRTSCEPCDPTEGSTLLSAGGTVQNKLDNTIKSLQTLRGPTSCKILPISFNFFLHFCACVSALSSMSFTSFACST